MFLAYGIFLLVLAIAVYVKRQDVAKLQAMLLGGSVVPGCVVFEVIVVALLAIGIVVAWFLGWI